MAGGLINSRIIQAAFTAAELTTANPFLIPHEIVYETDTGRKKMGDGANAWNTLPYMSSDAIPALKFKVSNNMLMVQPSVDLADPILKRCYVGVLRYKNARTRKRVNSIGVKVSRPKNKGYKVINDQPMDKPVTWTSIRITPQLFDVAQAKLNNGWMALISVEDFFHRFVEVGVDSAYCSGMKFKIHAGNKVYDDNFGHDSKGKIKQKATIYCGVVLLTKDALKAYRNEGPRAFFKVFSRNYDDNGGIISLK